MRFVLFAVFPNYPLHFLSCTDMDEILGVRGVALLLG